MIKILTLWLGMKILTQFGECDSLPNPVCAVAEPGAHAEN